MKLYDKRLEKNGISIKISDNARTYQKESRNTGNRKHFKYLNENKISFKGNFPVFFQNISLLLLAAMILMVNSSVNSYIDARFTPDSLRSYIKRDINPVPATPILVYDEKNDIDIIQNIPVPERPKENVIYDVKFIDQNEVGLPNGCEAVSMTMLLSRFIPNLSPHEFVNRYLPTAPYLEVRDGILTGSDPEHYYIGNPGNKGFGIFAAGLAAGAQKCLDAYGVTERKVYNVSGLSDEDLFEYVDNGQYVVVWISMNMYNITWGINKWHFPSGKLYKWPSPQHCALLIGHDATSISLYDPTNGHISYDKGLFLSRWHEMGPYEGQGRQAIVVY